MTRHPDPTESTVRKLFGTASRCGFPECREPLTRQGPAGRGRLINVRVAHICAAAQNGPRWRQMSSERNRAFENLLLLCLPHHDEVDNAEFLDTYTEELLREWKAAQVVDGEKDGTELTEAEVQSVIATFGDPITISDVHALSLGGQGGAAPGAGGGGGGVIGRGMGGPGGPAGRIKIAGDFASEPGAGGGGGGSMDPGSIAWTPDELQRGALGRASTTEGFDGQPTTVSDSSGNILASAAGGLAGSGERSTSDRVQLSSLMLGEYFSIRGGEITAVRGGWDRVTALNLPTTVGLPLLAVFEAGGVPAGEYTIHIETVSPAGVASNRVSFPFTVLEPAPVLRHPFCLSFQAAIEEYGIWELRVLTAVTQIGSITFVTKRVELPED